VGAALSAELAASVLVLALQAPHR